MKLTRAVVAMLLLAVMLPALAGIDAGHEKCVLVAPLQQLRHHGASLTFEWTSWLLHETSSSTPA